MGEYMSKTKRQTYSIMYLDMYSRETRIVHNKLKIHLIITNEVSRSFRRKFEVASSREEADSIIGVYWDAMMKIEEIECSLTGKQTPLELAKISQEKQKQFDNIMKLWIEEFKDVAQSLAKATVLINHHEYPNIFSEETINLAPATKREVANYE